ncbi:MAG TPA: CHAT domain-containing tetratricopeptide repeat protein [Anaerolineae bacterium]|nr:CHAT domain-containing tetratricopeptide repeat protein [Anaerolineae bacterium]
MAEALELPFTDAWLDQLLGLPTLEQQIDYLRSANILHVQGLSQLLDQATRLVRSDPGKARQLSIVCASAAGPAAAAIVLPRATYLRAQTHAINGEFNIALELIQSARHDYALIGEELEALRTNIGLMHVLNELGRHTEALEAGQTVLDAFAQQSELSPQAVFVLALAHQNRGVCYETTGRYEDALASYAAAESLYTQLELTERIGDIGNNRGIVLVHLGRVSEALAAFEQASRIWAAAGHTLLQAQTLSNLGDAHLALGNYARSLSAFEEARRLFDPLDAVSHKRILRRKTADAYLALNLYPEALTVYREADELLKDAGMADHRARALWGLGAALTAQARYEDAATALADAATLFAAADNTPMLSSVLLEQAALQNARDDRESAIKTAKQALALVGGGAWPVQCVYACLRLSDLLLPDTAAAEMYLLDAVRLSRHLSLPALNYRLNSRLGHLRRLQGNDREAEALLEEAAAQIETLRGSLAHEAIRTSFLRDKTAVYEDLIQLYLARGDEDSVRRAFAVAEQAKSRALVDLLTGVIVPASTLTGDPVLVSRLQALQADLSATYNRFLDATTEQNDVALAEIQARANRLEQDISLLRLQVSGSAAVPDPLTTPLALDALEEQLPPDLVLVAYHVVGAEVLAFVHARGKLHVVRQLSRVQTIQSLLQRLNAQWDRFRAGRDFAQRHMAVLEQSTQRILAELYTELVAPLASHLKQHGASHQAPRQLALVPHGVLHQVPFHALHDGQTYLLDQFEIAYAPSATVLALCQQRARRAARRALVVGLADSLIPAVNAEVQAVGQVLVELGVQTDVLIGEQAPVAVFNAAVSGRDVVHLACHGLFRADNPMFSSVKLHDGWLTAADALQLDLDAALVSLSACESGRSTVLLGDEVVGLPRAFLGAGAASVLVSLWLVQDEATAQLMTQWYRNLHRGLGRAAALRAAQQALRQQYPHPYYWAPFILVGQR